MTYEFSTTGRVEGGTLKTRNLRQMQAALSAWPDCEVVLTIEKAHANRSAQANRYYWGVVVHLIANHTGYTPEETHDVLKQMFLPKKLAMCRSNGEVIGEFVVGGSTTKLNKVDFGQYITAIREFAWQQLELDIPLPTEQDAAA